MCLQGPLEGRTPEFGAVQGGSAVGPENDRVIPQAVHAADMVVVRWGAVANNPTFAERNDQGTELLRAPGNQLHRTAKNKDGPPRTPGRRGYNLQQWPLSRWNGTPEFNC